MDDKHILSLLKAIYRANLNTIRIFAIDAVIVDDVGHLLVYSFESQSLVSQDCSVPLGVNYLSQLQLIGKAKSVSSTFCC